MKNYKRLNLEEREEISRMLAQNCSLNEIAKVLDLVIFKNTLHHIDVKYQIELINNLKKISRQLIIVDIDNPRYSGILSKIWNNYYRYFLGDCGNYFLSFEKFRKIIKDETKGLDHKVGLIKTVKGKYFFASLNMPH